MSALPLRADMLSLSMDVRYVPIADIDDYQETLLVGALEQLLAARLAPRALGQEVVEPAGRHFRNGREQEVGVGMMRRGEDLALDLSLIHI